MSMNVWKYIKKYTNSAREFLTFSSKSCGPSHATNNSRLAGSFFTCANRLKGEGKEGQIQKLEKGPNPGGV